MQTLSQGIQHLRDVSEEIYSLQLSGMAEIFVADVPLFESETWSREKLKDDGVRCFNFARDFKDVGLEPGATSALNEDYAEEFGNFTRLSKNPYAFLLWAQGVQNFLKRDGFKPVDSESVFHTPNLTAVFYKNSRNADITGIDWHKQNHNPEEKNMKQHDYHFVALRRLGKSNGVEDLVWAHKPGEEDAEVLARFDDPKALQKIEAYMAHSYFLESGGVYAVPKMPKEFTRKPVALIFGLSHSGPALAQSLS